MGRNGGPKTGGRQKGTPNKESTTAASIAARLGVDPMEILLYFAIGDYKALGYENELYHKETASGEVKMGYVITPETRMNAAKEAAKYIYPQLKALEHTGDVAGGLIFHVKDYANKKND